MKVKFLGNKWNSASMVCVLMLSQTALHAQATGSIAGRVADSTDAGIPGASVIASRPNGQTRTVLTGTDGTFRIDGLDVGAYRVLIRSARMAEESRQITVADGQTATVTVALRPVSVAQSVDVVATVEAVSGSVTKMDVPLIETPVAITVIPRAEMEEQAALSFQDAIRYTAGVSTGLYGFDSRGDWASVRGDENWGQYLNGLKMLFGYYNNVRPDVFALDSIQVMRGPSSVLFGQSGFGGALNLMSKRPLPQHHREIQVQYGSFNRKQLALDLTGPIDSQGKWLYRMVGLGRDSNTQVDYVPDNRLLFAPSLTWRPRTGTYLTVLTNFQQDKGGSSLGFFPWQGTLLPNPAGQIPTNAFISEPGFDEYRTEQIAVGYLFQHEFNRNWTVRQNLNYIDSNASYQSLWSSFNPSPHFNPDNRTIDRDIYVSKPRMRSPVVDTQVETHFRTFGIRHNFLGGVDYQQATITGRNAFGTAPAIDVFNPQYGNFTVPQLFDLPESRQDQVGVYAQDHMQFAEHLSVMLGIRRDRATSETKGDATSYNEDSATTGRVGVIYNTNLGLAPYFNYSQSFLPMAGANVFNQPYDPIRARQFETGVKFQPAGSDSILSAAVFDIREKNRLTPDPQNPLNSIQVGEARIRGVELEGRTKIVWKTNLIANYTFLDARISESTGPDMGMRIPIIPKHAGSLWAIKGFHVARLKGTFSGGGGIRYNGASYEGYDQLRTPSYTLLDLMASYDRASWRFGINVSNLTDRVYVASCLARGDCFWGQRRAITASVRYRF